MSGRSLTCWKVRAIPRVARWRGASRVTSVPSSRMRPASRASVPVITSMRVLLPAPFGPISASTSCERTAKLTSLTAMSAPKRLVAPAISSTVSGEPADAARGGNGAAVAGFSASPRGKRRASIGTTPPRAFCSSTTNSTPKNTISSCAL